MSSAPIRLTTPDLVLLSLLTEKAQHGYELNAELERRQVADWAGVSRAQVYYSLRKLAEAKLVQAVEGSAASAGPERQVYRITGTGKGALSGALEREDWATQRQPPAFLTWLALSPHAAPETVARMLAVRSAFVTGELEREREHLESIRADSGAMVQVAKLMVTRTIAVLEGELGWLEHVGRVLNR